MKKFLVCLDGSPNAAGVMDAAASLASRVDAELVLLRATSIPGDLPIEAYASDPEAITGVLEKRARDDLLTLAARAPSGLVTAVRVDIGPAWKVIEAAARDEDCDLVVIGSHGYGAVERLLGTTAAKVVNHADRSVLVVREPRRIE